MGAGSKHRRPRRASLTSGGLEANSFWRDRRFSAPDSMRASLAGRGGRFPNPRAGNPNPPGRKSKGSATKSKSGGTKSKRKGTQNPSSFVPLIATFQPLRLQVQDSGDPPISAWPPDNASKVKQHEAPPQSSGRTSIPDPTTAGTIAQTSDYRNQLSPFIAPICGDAPVATIPPERGLL